MEQQLRQAKEAAMDGLKVGLDAVAQRLLPALANGQATDWRLMGRCLARVELDIRDHLETCADVPEVHQVIKTLFAPGNLETRVKAAYLFARLHPHELARPGAGRGMAANLPDSGSG